MTAMILGLVLFFAVHSVSIVAEPWRNAMVARIGEWPWKGLYSLVSLASLVLIVWGYGLARAEPVLLYVPPAWLRHLALALLVPVFPLLLAAYFPGHIQRATKHPMLLSIKLWALAHLLANGMLADLLLFGGFLIWAGACRASMKHRTPRRLPGALPSAVNDSIAVLAGLALYVGFVLWFHVWLIGVSPI